MRIPLSQPRSTCKASHGIKRPGLPAWALLLAMLAACPADDDDASIPDAADSPTPFPTPVPDQFSWDNATVYFVMTDRFLDGDPSNNESYGRAPDGDKEIGTFHGGDLIGLTEKVREGFFTDLGVTAIWFTAPYEQIHGWVVGGNNEFQHYAYHGYYALDFTRMDANMGTEDDLEAFVDAAHRRGIRVLMDVVMNHPGYATIQDLHEFGVDVLLDGWENATIDDYYDYIDFDSPEFAEWWGVNWIRAGLGGGYDPGGTDDLTMGVAYLPDFKTESTETDIGLPPFYANKPDTNAVEVPSYTVRNYLVAWLTDWVARFGIDGFRCDTVKHVEKEAWAELKDAANDALAEWRDTHPDKAFPDEDYPAPERPFWMTGEVFPHGAYRDDYFDHGFDALINFDFQGIAAGALDDPGSIDATYQAYADTINSDPTFNVLSYLSSHDTYLFYSQFAHIDPDKQKLAGTLLLLTPGAVQIFYGDENARPPGPSSTDSTQPTRSDYVWGDHPDVLEHWSKVGRFRRRHLAVGAGSHRKIADMPYVFRRAKGDDVVYCVIGATESVSVEVAADWPDGTALRDAYTGTTTTVENGVATFSPDNSGVILIEPVSSNPQGRTPPARGAEGALSARRN